MNCEEIIKKAQESGDLEAVRIIKGFLTGENESGMHIHVLNRDENRTLHDGSHSHLFILPSGDSMVSSIDGDHNHQVSEGGDWTNHSDVGHKHIVELPEGLVAKTMDYDGSHSHNLMLETTALDGGHIHWLILEDGSMIRSETAGSFAKKFGSITLLQKAKDVVKKLFKQEHAIEKEDLSEDQKIALAALGYSYQDTNMIKKEIEKEEKKEIESKQIQSIIFKKDRYDESQVKAFIKKNGFKSAEIEVTDDSFKVQQLEIKSFTNNSFETSIFKGEDGVKALIGKMKTSEEQEFDTLYDCPIIKTDEDKQVVFGIVLAPEEVDTQGDIMSIEEIEKTAHFFMKESQTVGMGHVIKAEAKVIESYIAPVDFEQDSPYGKQEIKKGTWIIGVHVTDEKLWSKVKKGEVQGFSAGGFGLRTPEE